MDRLWAPWRSKYIYLRKHPACIFCNHKLPKNDSKHYILGRTKHSFAMLNLYPYNNGHVMVAPYRHVKTIELLTADEITDLFTHVAMMKTHIDKVMKPHGFNIGANIGRVAGAGFAGHLHIHIVPRWNGDSNFMPVVADTKIVSESLDIVYGMLKTAYCRSAQKSRKSRGRSRS